ncbi:MAG: Single-stranded DNA-binding protein [Parcubacteria group bacterium GW2011_GWC2_39_14]|nr:MAG: Single-stranded DNA-binding protein [Parcubacteria group bacterium GW2011_GWC2_39_14]KKR53688.1 MAG: Single-stranded DNA-binding protein [Parcubacteria group bacterium GW2011_GWA2_40_23]
MDLNKAMIIGRLTADPETRTTPQGTSVSAFSLATNFVWNDASGQKQDKVEFHNIVAWRKLAEICAQYLKKGSKIYVEGRLQTRSWDGQDGVKRYRTEIIADNMIMLDRAGGAGSPAPASNNNSFIKDAQNTELPTIEQEVEEEEIKVENIPF